MFEDDISVHNMHYNTLEKIDMYVSCRYSDYCILMLYTM